MSGSDTVMNEAHQRHSSLREKVVEHVFVGEALRALWRRGVYDVEVLRGEFDAHGYDLVMARGKTVRHIQFKTGVRHRPIRLSISTALEAKPSGCVIWIQVDDALDMLSFWWLGGAPGEQLPSLGDRRARRIGRTALGKRPEREAHRMVKGSTFTRLGTVDEVLEKLFGELPHDAPPSIVDESEKVDPN